MTSGFVIAKRGGKFYANATPYIDEIIGSHPEWQWFGVMNTFTGPQWDCLEAFSTLEAAKKDLEPYLELSPNVATAFIEIDEVNKMVKVLSLPA